MGWYPIHSTPQTEQEFVIKICKESSCGKKRRSRGWCQLHYDRWRKHGDPNLVKQNQAPKGYYGIICDVKDCSRKHFAKSYCHIHYRRWKKYGDPHFIKMKPDKAYDYAKRKQLYQSVVDRDGEYCRFCGSKERLTIDRIYPGNLGGEYRLDNCQLLCISCNCSKQDKYDIFAFALRLKLSVATC